MKTAGLPTLSRLLAPCWAPAFPGSRRAGYRARCGRARSLDAAALRAHRAAEPCTDYAPTRRPLFGDLHVHQQLPSTPTFPASGAIPGCLPLCRGDGIILPDANGEQAVRAKIGRPLDFTAVTDHAEFFGQINVCTQDGKPGYW